MLQLCQLQRARKMLSWVTLVKGPVLRINYSDKASVRQTHFVRLSLKRTKRSPRRHWYMLSSHPVLTAATPCWPRRQRSLLIVCRMRSSGSQRNSQVRPRLDTSVPLRAPLAGCSSVYPIQPRNDCSQRNAPRLLQVYDWCCQSSAASLCKSPSAHRATTRRTKFGRRAFSVAGPTVWNSLPDYLRDPSLSEYTFRRSLKA